MTRTRRASDDRRADGKALRAGCPRSSHAGLALRTTRDPNALLEASSEGRVPRLVPLRYGRMQASSLAYFRATASIQSFDLATTPSSGIEVPSCGDAHLLNFGFFATPERAIAFDINDFDETWTAPFEWDVKRLATSVVLASGFLGFPEVAKTAARACVESYREHARRYAELGALDVWFERLDLDRLRAAADGPEQRRLLDRVEERARKRTQGSLLAKITERHHGRLRLLDRPPLLFHLDGSHARERDLVWTQAEVLKSLEAYRETLQPDRRALLERFRVIDVAFKVVGVGSVGTRCLVLLFVDADGHPLFLQLKEARPSALAPHVRATKFGHEGERIVSGQRLLQATSDPMLGWTHGPQGHDYYVRQLRDMKTSADVRSMDAASFVDYVRDCAWALSRAHARASGRAAEIAGYLGSSDRFDVAVAEYALAYAKQVERDYESFREAVRTKRFTVETEGELSADFRL